MYNIKIEFNNNLYTLYQYIMTTRKLHIFINNIEYKICGKCKTDKTLDNFNNSSTSWDSLRWTCKNCLKLYRANENTKKNKKNYNKKYWIKMDKEKERERQRIYRKNNREKIKEKRKIYDKKYNNKNKNNPRFKLIRHYRNELYKFVKKGKSSENYVGCDLNFLKKHLENQFDENMNWNNYGSYWNIDHIIPCSSFDMENNFDINSCFNYRNLQPMECELNSSKNNKYNPDDKKLYLEKFLKIFDKDNEQLKKKIEDQHKNEKLQIQIKIYKNKYIFVIEELNKLFNKKKKILQEKNTTHRVCSKCKINKLLNQFYNSERRKLNKAYICIECAKKSKGIWKDKNKEHISEYNKNYRLKNKEKIQNYYKKSDKEKKDNKYIRKLKYYNKFAELCKSFGAICISKVEEYENAHSKLKIKCLPLNHITEKSLNNLNKRTYCSLCNNQKKVKKNKSKSRQELNRERKLKYYNKFVELCESFEAICISKAEEYENAKSRLKIKCINNHITEKNLSNLKNRTYCSICKKNRF